MPNLLGKFTQRVKSFGTPFPIDPRIAFDKSFASRAPCFFLCHVVLLLHNYRPNRKPVNRKPWALGRAALAFATVPASLPNLSPLNAALFWLPLAINPGGTIVKI